MRFWNLNCDANINLLGASTAELLNNLRSLGVVCVCMSIVARHALRHYFNERNVHNVFFLLASAHKVVVTSNTPNVILNIKCVHVGTKY